MGVGGFVGGVCKKEEGNTAVVVLNSPTRVGCPILLGFASSIKDYSNPCFILMQEG